MAATATSSYTDDAVPFAQRSDSDDRGHAVVPEYRSKQARECHVAVCASPEGETVKKAKSSDVQHRRRRVATVATSSTTSLGEGSVWIDAGQSGASVL
jgi:hypothetical protein